MTTAPRRLLAAAAAMGAVAAIAWLLWHWLPGPRSQARDVPAAAAPPTASLAAASDRGTLPPPRLRASAATEEAAPAMSEGLAQDLEMFDGTQLKAELESLALSHPGVQVLEAVCSGLPCRAEVATASAVQLGGYSLAVHQRFQGHVSLRTQRLPGQLGDGGQPLMRTTFWVGTPASARP